MNGPEHYAEAERLVEGVQHPLEKLIDAVEAGEDITAAQRGVDVALSTAKVHAILSLVCAQVDAVPAMSWMNDAWQEATA